MQQQKSLLEVLAEVADAADPLPLPPKCSYVDDCAFKGQITILVRRIFGRPTHCGKNIPGQYWLWICSTHKKEYQSIRTPLAQYNLVEKQVELLLKMQVKWVVRFRNGEEDLLIGNKTLKGVRWESNVYFIDFPGQELSALLEHIKERIITPETYGFENVMIMPFSNREEYSTRRWARYGILSN